MSASNAQGLLDGAKCYTCVGVSVVDALRLALLDNISQNISGGGGSDIPLDGLVGWYLPTSIVPQSDGDPITAWNDVSPSGNHFVAASGNATFMTNQVNGNAAAYFDGTGQRLDAASVFSGNNERTLIVVYKQTDFQGGGVGRIVGQNGPDLTINTWFFFNTTAFGNPYLSLINNDLIGGLGESPSVIVTMATHGLDGFLDRVKLYIGDSLETQNAQTLATVASDLNLGDSTIFSAPFLGLICEIIIYDRQITSTEITQIASYLTAKYDYLRPPLLADAFPDIQWTAAPGPLPDQWQILTSASFGGPYTVEATVPGVDDLYTQITPAVYYFVRGIDASSNPVTGISNPIASSV